jgi:hypothetical protein
MKQTRQFLWRTVLTSLAVGLVISPLSAGAEALTDVALTAPVDATTVSAPAAPTLTPAEPVAAAATAPVATPQDTPVVTAPAVTPVVAPAPVPQSTPAPTPTSIPATVTTPAYAPVEHPTSSNDIVISSFRLASTGTTFDYIELTNRTDKFVDLAPYSIVLVQPAMSNGAVIDSAMCQIPLSGFIKSSSAIGLSSFDLHNAIRFSCGDFAPEGAMRAVRVLRAGVLIEEIFITDITTATQPHPGEIWKRSMTSQTGNLIKDFSRQKPTATIRDDLTQVYELPYDSLPFRVIEFLPNVAKQCVERDVLTTASGCRPYIKLENLTNEPIDLSQFVMRSGVAGTQTTSQYKSQLSGVLPKRGWLTIEQTVRGDNLYFADQGTVWFEDQFNLKEYDAGVAAYESADTVANTGKTWAYFAEDLAWRWAEPTPQAHENRDIVPELETTPGKGAVELTPCKEGQYRSAETGRCRQITSTKSPAACKDGQYRSEETGRCRSIVSAVASALKPCGEGQFRNPTSGRCKKIASTDDIVKPCDEGYTRNPLTNRCRKTPTSEMPLAAFPVQPIATNSNSASTWWGLAAIAVAALGYGAWEWRTEIGRGVRRLVTFGHK